MFLLLKEQKRKVLIRKKERKKEFGKQLVSLVESPASRTLIETSTSAYTLKAVLSPITILSRKPPDEITMLPSQVLHNVRGILHEQSYSISCSINGNLNYIRKEHTFFSLILNALLDNLFLTLKHKQLLMADVKLPFKILHWKELEELERLSSMVRRKRRTAAF